MHKYHGLFIAILVIVCDQWSKWWVFGLLSTEPGLKIEVTSFFNLVMVWNKGISFGLFGQTGYGHIIFSLTSLVIVCVLLGWLWKAGNNWLIVALGLVIGGAVGNIIDRMRFKAVADFLDFHVGNWHWPAFNIADSAICIGVALLCVEGLLIQPKKDNSNTAVQ